jgi:Bifunctional DNA primase/polymerase, N-terminal
MTDATLRQALAYARRGWPVFPCLPGQKIPATTHGYQDATTDEQQITAWFGRSQRWNLAIGTGHPGPDVLDIDQHGQAGNGYLAYGRLRRAGLVNGAAAYVRTPAVASWPRPPRSAANPTGSSAGPVAAAPWTGSPSPL